MGHQRATPLLWKEKAEPLFVCVLLVVIIIARFGYCFFVRGVRGCGCVVVRACVREGMLSLLFWYDRITGPTVYAGCL